MVKKIQTGERDQEILYELKRISRLLGVLVVGEGRSMVDKVALLFQMGFSTREIAAMLGTTPQTVSVALHKARAITKKKQ